MLYLNRLVFSPSVFFKNTVSKKRTARFDLTFRRRDIFRKKYFQHSNINYFTLLDYKIPRTEFFPKRKTRRKAIKKFWWRKKKVNSKIFKHDARFIPNFSSSRRRVQKALFSQKRSQVFFQYLKATYFRRVLKRKPKLKHINVFNKFWQRIVFNRLKKNVEPHNFKPYLKPSSSSKNFFTAPLARQVGTSLDFEKITLISFVRKLWPTLNLSFCLMLIKHGLFTVNGVYVFDPFFYLEFFSILRLNISGLQFITFVFLISRFCRSALFHRFSKLKFKSLFLGGFFEFNFKLSEIMILPSSTYSPFCLPFAELKTSSNFLLQQRFYKKQKRFGLGR